MTFEKDDARSGTEKAMNLLNATQADKIAWGEYLAVRIAKRGLSVHSRSLREELVKEKIIPEESAQKEYWLGAVFNNLRNEGVIEKNGTFKYSDPSRNIHERTVTIWQLTRSANLERFKEAPKRPGEKE